MAWTPAHVMDMKFCPQSGFISFQLSKKLRPLMGPDSRSSFESLNPQSSLQWVTTPEASCALGLHDFLPFLATNLR